MEGGRCRDRDGGLYRCRSSTGLPAFFPSHHRRVCRWSRARPGPAQHPLRIAGRCGGKSCGRPPYGDAWLVVPRRGGCVARTMRAETATWFPCGETLDGRRGESTIGERARAVQIGLQKTHDDANCPPPISRPVRGRPSSALRSRGNRRARMPAPRRDRGAGGRRARSSWDARRRFRSRGTRAVQLRGPLRHARRAGAAARTHRARGGGHRRRAARSAHRSPGASRAPDCPSAPLRSGSAPGRLIFPGTSLD
jgi:hypothetical protein